MHFFSWTRGACASARVRATCLRQWAKWKNFPGKPWTRRACGCDPFFTFVLLTTLRQLGGWPCERGVRSTFTLVIEIWNFVCQFQQKQFPGRPLIVLVVGSIIVPEPNESEEFCFHFQAYSPWNSVFGWSDFMAFLKFDCVWLFITFSIDLIPDRVQDHLA